MKTPLTPEELAMQAKIKTFTIRELALLIRKDWKKVYFGAAPYLEVMFSIESINDQYGADSAKSIVNYFLSNASVWRGSVAKLVKAELNSRIK